MSGAKAKVKSDKLFWSSLAGLSLVFVVLLFGMLGSLAFFASPSHLLDALKDENIRFALKLSLISCTLTALISVWVAVPTGYIMSRCKFPGKAFLDACLDIPIVLPPLVVGLGLLILFEMPIGTMENPKGGPPLPMSLDDFFSHKLGMPITFEVPSIILAQFMVACAFAIRTMRVSFDDLDERYEKVALTLGCSRAQAFFRVVLPDVKRGMVTAGMLAWSRALGEFGPILIFSSASRMRTEVLPTTIWLEFSIGNLNNAVAVSLILVICAVAVLMVTRFLGLRHKAGGL